MPIPGTGAGAGAAFSGATAALRRGRSAAWAAQTLAASKRSRPRLRNTAIDTPLPPQRVASLHLCRAAVAGPIAAAPPLRDRR
jgi:hypothetical protein